VQFYNMIFYVEETHISRAEYRLGGGHVHCRRGNMANIPARQGRKIFENNAPDATLDQGGTAWFGACTSAPPPLANCLLDVAGRGGVGRRDTLPAGRAPRASVARTATASRPLQADSESR